MKKTSKKLTDGNGANLGFEEKLWQAADKMRGHMDPAQYKHVALGLIFLKYISDAFEEHRVKLAADKNADPEDREKQLDPTQQSGGPGEILARQSLSLDPSADPDRSDRAHKAKPRDDD